MSLASVHSASAEPSIAEKQAQAQGVLAQIRGIDSQLAHAIEDYNLANVRLAKIEDDLTANARYLKLAKSSLKGAQRHLSERLVSLYVHGDDASAMEVLLGAESLDDLLSRLDAVERVSAQDSRVLREVQAFKREVQQRKVELKQARVAQKREVANRAARRAAIEGQLQERQSLLASIRSEIATLQAAEARRQARLEAQARERVAALAQQRQVQSLGATTSEPSVSADAAAAEVASPEVIAPAPAARYGGVVGIAMQYLGVPYRWGGADPSGFDCSGFSMYVFGKIGVSLPHHAASQYGLGSPVSKADLQAGDLVFFNGLGHMGIYIGGGQFIHAPHTGDVVKISSLSDSWYAATWVGARRL
ncbi:MAG: NlpC/P60 family protein [Gaiellaceae bacterium]|nr:NlpC/P60 family protein [Gaiellaceae bacterium]